MSESKLRLSVHCEEFDTPEALNQTLQKWAKEFPQSQYKMIINDAVSKVLTVAQSFENGDDLLVGLYDVASETIEDFEKFMRNKKSPNSIWKKLERIAKRNKASKPAKATVLRYWGQQGLSMVQAGNSIPHWVHAVASLARLSGNYHKAMEVVTRTVNRRVKGARTGGKASNSQPTITDLEIAICYFKAARRGIGQIEAVKENPEIEVDRAVSNDTMTGIDSSDMDNILDRYPSSSGRIKQEESDRHSEHLTILEGDNLVPVPITHTSAVQSNIPTTQREHFPIPGPSTPALCFHYSVPHFLDNIRGSVDRTPVRDPPILGNECIILENVWNWWQEPVYLGVSLLDLGHLEARIFLHHHNNEIATLEGHQYGILHQLMEVEPLFWLLNVGLQSKTELVAFPQPVSFSSVANTESFPLDFPYPPEAKLRNITKVSHNPSADRFVTFVDGDGREVRYCPSLVSRETLHSIVSTRGIITEDTLKKLRQEKAAIGIYLSTGVNLTITSSWPLASVLRGLSPLSDAILLQRPYNDPEVQAEMAVLLGEDRDIAWQMIIQWRKLAVEYVKYHFKLWLEIEKQAFPATSYQKP